MRVWRFFCSKIEGVIRIYNAYDFTFRASKGAPQDVRRIKQRHRRDNRCLLPFLKERIARFCVQHGAVLADGHLVRLNVQLPGY